MEELNNADLELVEQNREAVCHTGEVQDTNCSPWWLLTTLQTHEGCGQKDINALATERNAPPLRQ